MRAAFPSSPALAIFVAGCAVLTLRAGVAAGAAPAPVAARPFAVVELFTSQGCNSCPRADDALARLTAETGDGERIFAIEWHVDYWDYLGWPDPYATRAATDRQRRYARALPSQLYTPQLVINGATVVRPAQDAGLLRGAAFAALEARAGRPLWRRRRPRAAPAVGVAIAARALPAGVVVDYTIGAAPPDAMLLLVLVEDGLSNYVPRGENAGRTLRHVSTARAFTEVAVAPAVRGAWSGTARLGVPAGLVPERAAIVALVQDPRTMRIIGAARSPLS